MTEQHHTQRGDYFQKQGYFSNQCGMHVLNNFLGHHKYTQRQMNKICNQLSSEFINPHRSIFGGNYDVNVLIYAFQQEGFDLSYHDARDNVTILGTQLGFVINRKPQSCCSQLFQRIFDVGRHWILIKATENGYLQLDSLRSRAVPLSQTQALKTLQSQRNNQSTILRVFRIREDSTPSPHS